jgi:hypothetical protein
VFEELSATRGLTMYLMSTQTEAEAQRDITAKKVQVISQQNVYLVVRDAIKKKKRFANKASVLGFTEFFCKRVAALEGGVDKRRRECICRVEYSRVQSCGEGNEKRSVAEAGVTG